MNIANHHPEYQMNVYGMQAGYLPASKEDLAGVAAAPVETFTPSSHAKESLGPEHPEYVDYCAYAKSLGFSGC